MATLGVIEQKATTRPGNKVAYQNRSSKTSTLQIKQIYKTEIVSR